MVDFVPFPEPQPGTTQFFVVQDQQLHGGHRLIGGIRHAGPFENREAARAALARIQPINAAARIVRVEWEDL